MSVFGISNGVQGLANTAKGGLDISTRLSGGSYWSQLKPASYKGVPFGTIGGSATFGRRNAVHEYPYRDTPWVEDLGRASREFIVSGFVVGDDAIARRDRLIAKLEEPGDGDLVHPTLGKRKAAVLDFNVQEHRDRGRVFEFTLRCMEQGSRQYPETSKQGQAAVGAAADLSNFQAAKAFAQKSLAALKAGAAAANEGAQQAAAWASLAVQYGRDATSLINLAKTVPGQFGRLVGQTLGVRSGELVPKTLYRTTDDLKGVAAASRVKVSDSQASVNTAGTELGPNSTDTFTTSVQGMAATVRSEASTPGDAIVALSSMAGYSTPRTSSGAAAVVLAETVLLLQRAAAVELARAAAEYRPASSQDAARVRDLVAAVLELQMLLAGDRGDDSTYQTLRDLRATVIDDLNTRGGSVPEIVTVSSPSSLPSLVLAQRLYRNVDREAELVQRAQAVHPAFMPTTFKALSA
jgi:prophage DNA circulation protein